MVLGKERRRPCIEQQDAFHSGFPLRLPNNRNKSSFWFFLEELHSDKRHLLAISNLRGGQVDGSLITKHILHDLSCSATKRRY